MDDSSLYSYCHLDNDFLEIYKQLNDSHEIYFISSRLDGTEYGKDVIMETNKFFCHHNIKNKVIITNNKKQFIEDLQLDIFIDDAIHNLNDLNDNTVKILLNKPWNGLDEINRLSKKGIIFNSKIKRIDNIKEIVKYLK